VQPASKQVLTRVQLVPKSLVRVRVPRGGVDPATSVDGPVTARETLAGRLADSYGVRAAVVPDSRNVGRAVAIEVPGNPSGSPNCSDEPLWAIASQCGREPCGGAEQYADTY
jgi:hypothetical protein